MSVSDLVAERFQQTLWNLLQETPIDKITVDEIVANSGFSKRTFYNHFRDKNDLVSNIWKREYRSCWFDEDGRPLTFHDFLVKYHAHEFEIYQFLRHTLPYSGQNNLWETVQETSVACLIDFIERCGYGYKLDEQLRKSIEFFAHGVNGLAQAEFQESIIRHLREYDKSPQERADEEVRFIPAELQPYLLADPNHPHVRCDG